MYKKKFTHFIYDAVFIDPEPAKTAVSSAENKENPCLTQGFSCNIGLWAMSLFIIF